MKIDLKEIEKNLPAYKKCNLSGIESIELIYGSKAYEYEHAFDCEENRSQAFHNAIRAAIKQGQEFADLPKAYQDKIIEIEGKFKKFYNRHIGQVIERQAKRKFVLIVTGSRQVGKTTILEHLVNDAKYITLDDPMLRLNAEENAVAFMADHKPPIIIDEIQKCPHLFDYIKMAVDKNKIAGQYYLTGSHSFSLMKGVTESLAGRAGIIKMLGLSLRELNEIEYSKPFLPTHEHFDSISKSKFDYSKIVDIIHTGSFPELHAAETDPRDWKDYYASYLQSYLEKDVKDLIRTDNMSAFVKFLKGVASLSGEILNATALAEICGMNVMTVKEWLSILEMSGHIYMLQPYFNNQNKRLVKSPKLYLLDTGLLCYLSGWNTKEQLTSGARWGQIFETYIVGEILKSYYNDGDNFSPPLYYYRDKDKVEVDLIIENGGTLHPVEIKATTSPNKMMTKSFAVLDKIADKKRGSGAVICMYEHILTLSENDKSINPGLI